MTEHLSNLIASHGYWVVAAVVALESMGIPMPGETTLVTAAIYAGTTHRLNIGWVIASASTGAIVGDNIGYWIGRRFGYDLLLRYGPLVRIGTARIKLGQYLFNEHGGKVVFFGRFIALLRTLAALLAGVTCMEWWRFLLFNVTGGILWATVFGLAAYVFGERLERVRGPLSILELVLAAAAGAVGAWWMHGHATALQAKAERALPGPLARHARPRE